MRVLMSLPDKRVRGGPPAHLGLLVDGLRSLGVQVETFLFGGRHHRETRAEKILYRAVDVLRFPFLILRHHPDIIQLNSAYNKQGLLRDVVFVAVARLLPGKLVLKFHGSDLELLEHGGRFWQALTRIVVWAADLICVLNREESQSFKLRFPSARVAVVKNILDLQRFATQKDFRSRYSIPSTKPLLLFIARFLPEKGAEDVVRALPRILESHDVVAAFVGDGPARQAAESLCGALGLQERTFFTGYIPEEDTTGCYMTADVLVFPTYYGEGMPMVVFHSLASGLPIVTTRIRALHDWLEDDKHCIFVGARNHDEVSAAVIRLLSDGALRRRLSQNGRSLAQRFNRTSVAGEFLSLYKETLNGTSVKPAG